MQAWVQRCVIAYRVSLPPNVPIRAKRRRFRTVPFPPWQSLLLCMATYSIVASWVMHTTLMALLLRFELPSLCGCSYWDQWDHGEWYRILREATAR